MLAAPKEALSTNVKQDGKSIDKKGGGGLRTHITHSLLRSEQCTMASTRPKGRREGAFLKTNFKFGLEVALEKKKIQLRQTTHSSTEARAVGLVLFPREALASNFFVPVIPPKRPRRQSKSCSFQREFPPKTSDRRSALTWRMLVRRCTPGWGVRKWDKKAHSLQMVSRTSRRLQSVFSCVLSLSLSSGAAAAVASFPSTPSLSTVSTLLLFDVFSFVPFEWHLRMPCCQAFGF